MAAFQVLSLPQSSPFVPLALWPFFSEATLPAFLSQMDLFGYGFKFSPHLTPARKRPSRLADFSIRSILSLEGSGDLGASQGQNPEEEPEDTSPNARAAQGEYSWIHCTRFKPPKIAKMKKEGLPRRTSRSPRVPFSSFQLSVLEGRFRQTRYLSTNQVREISTQLGLTENRVKIWFQNRRARERRDFLRGHRIMSPLREASHLHPSSGNEGPRITLEMTF